MLELIFLAVFLLFFCASRLSEFGFGPYWVSMAFCAACLYLLAIFAYRKRWLDQLAGNRNFRILMILLGILVAIPLRAVPKANNFIEVLGAGILFGLYLIVWFTIFKPQKNPKQHRKKSPIPISLEPALKQTPRQRYARRKTPSRPPPVSPQKYQRRRSILFFAGTMLLLNLAAAIYLANSDTIYFWDNAGYWQRAADIAHGSLSGHLLKSVYEMILSDDYNVLAALLPAFLMKVFGSSRAVFVLAIVNFYTLPCVMIVYSIAKHYTTRPVVISAAALFSCPTLLYLSLSGFVDIGGMIPALLCCWLYLAGKENAKKYFLLGLLLTLTILFRRWYAFFALSFVLAMLFDCLLSHKKLFYVIVTILHMGFLLLMFFGDFVTGKLLADYGSLYADYKFSLVTDLRITTRYFGVIPLALTALGGIWLALRKKDRTALFLVLQMGLCFFLFVHTQTHGQQHMLLYIPAFLVALIAILSSVSLSTRSATVLLCLSLVCSANVLVSRSQPSSISEIRHFALVPDFYLHSPKRNDTKEILALKQYLDQTVPKDQHAGILASSFVLNEDILRNVQASLNVKNAGGTEADSKYIINLPAVDSRDHDIAALYWVEYMVVATPAQTHLPEGSQRLVTEPVKSFEGQTDFARAFEKLEREFSFSGIRVSVYRRVRDVTNEEKAELESRIWPAG
jgi:hypothetical protein